MTSSVARLIWSLIINTHGLKNVVFTTEYTWLSGYGGGRIQLRELCRLANKQCLIIVNGGDRSVRSADRILDPLAHHADRFSSRYIPGDGRSPMSTFYGMGRCTRSHPVLLKSRSCH